MGFYGKVTNKNATQFVIDKIYPNRVEMDTNVNTDNVFVGRYVLIEYGRDSYPMLFKIVDKNNKEKFYFSRLLNEESRAKYLSEEKYLKEYNDLSYLDDYYIRKDDIIFILKENLEQEYYICTGQDNNYAVFSLMEENPPLNDNSYFKNYTEDIQKYGDSRGFDSTVWQKIYVDEKEKYVMIAELNSVVPTFDLTIDAPTHEPVVPHFDADSTNVYYRLHVQPSWGFKVKDASEQPGQSDGNSYPSDIDIDYTERVYDPEDKNYKDEPMKYKAAIYFNKAGFFPKTKITSQSEQVYDASTGELKAVQDEILLKPTGKSQQAYNIHDSKNPFKKAISEDTQELIMMLPSIGDSISALWDIIYNNPGEGNDRNDDIEWGSRGGVRMVSTTDDGYSYKPEKTKTIAGAINSVHDLMGMIVDNQYQNLEEVPLDNVDTDKIYYYNNKFYIKEKGYEWVEANDGVSPYKEILLADTYSPNNYYLKTLNQDYELSMAPEMREGVLYYKLTDIEKVDLDPEYTANKYYYLDGKDYKIDTGLYDKNKTYFKNLVENSVTGNNKYFFVAQKHIEINSGRFKGLFYYNDKNIEIPCDETSTIEFSEISKLKPFIGVYTKIEEWSPSENKVVTTYNFEQKVPVTLIEYDTNVEYYKKSDKNYIYLEGIPENYYKTSIPYYTITSIIQIKNFYEPNKYYYKTLIDNNSYRWSNGSYNKDHIYYTLKAEGPYQYFYEPNKYYYQENGNYILSSSPNLVEGRTYYNYSDLYVHPDNENTKFVAGSLWNPNLNKDNFYNLKLGYRYDDWQWKELKGFAHTLNTIHGLIIEINNILKTGDLLTRDNNTVQGCINQINDIIDKINTLSPGEILIADNLGKIKSSPHTTRQEFGYKNTGTGEIKTISSLEAEIDLNEERRRIEIEEIRSDPNLSQSEKNRRINIINDNYTEIRQDLEAEISDLNKNDCWIGLNIRDLNEDPLITLSHKFNEVNSTEETFDFNDYIDEENFKTYFPIVDTTGHIVGNHYKTITLPYGFKTISANKIDNDGLMIPSGKIVAVNLQDSIDIESDRWLTVTANTNDSNNHTLSIVHNNPKPPIGEILAVDQTPNFGDSISIPIYNFDEKGHQNQELFFNMTIPKGSLKDTEKTGSDIITQLNFTPSTGEIKTVREDIANLKLNSYIKNSDNSDIIDTDTLGNALSKLQTQIIDEEIARENLISNTADNLNKAIEKEVNDRKAAIEALDSTLSTETSAEVITSITQTDGKLTSIDKTKVGNLTLNGWTLGESVVNSADDIADTDTVNGAFAKAQRQINANKVALAVLNGNSTTKGSVAYQIAEMVIKADGNGIDKLEEIAAWIVNDTTGAAKMNSDIKANTDAIDALELLVGNTAVATQIADAINNALLVDDVNKYALAADLVNLSTTVSNINDRVEDLELAVSAEKIAQWDAAEVNIQSDWAETDETADSYIKNKPTLDFVPMETYNALLERIAALEARIEALENPVVEEPTPDPENPEEPVE